MRFKRPISLALLVVGSFFLMAAEWDSCVRLDKETQFSDVDDSHPHYKGIRLAEAHDVYAGYPDGSLRPNEVISRQQIATLVERRFPTGATRGEVASFMAGGWYATLQNSIVVEGANSGSNSATITVTNNASFALNADEWVLDIDNGEYGDAKKQEIITGLGTLSPGGSRSFEVTFKAEGAVLYDRDSDFVDSQKSFPSDGIRLASWTELR